jgi:hypothetical protein
MEMEDVHGIMSDMVKNVVVFCGCVVCIWIIIQTIVMQWEQRKSQCLQAFQIISYG